LVASLEEFTTWRIIKEEGEMSNDIVLYQRVSHLEKELDEVLKELSQLKQNYQEVLDMLRSKAAKKEKK
jgi:regulator of replication initiation timing